MRCLMLGLAGLGLVACVGQVVAADEKPHVVFVINEDEYAAGKTLPVFAKLLEQGYGCRTTVLNGHGKHAVDGLDALESADLVVLFARRRGLPKQQMDRVRKYLDAGKPLVAIRTASHAFAPGAAAPRDIEQWPTFDVDVLGCHYHGHGPNSMGTEVAAADDATDHLILRGVEPLTWRSRGSIYYSVPLDKKAKVLLNGSADKRTEPIAWTRMYRNSRVFYTSLGHPDDFEQPQFRTMLTNAVFWAMDRPAPKP